MAIPKDQDCGNTALVFAAYNTHSDQCGVPPRVRNTANPEWYHGYFENCHGEQFVFCFDRASGAGMVTGGDLGWDEPKEFTLELVEQALRSTRNLAALIVPNERGELPNLPVIDAALALGRLTGLTGKEEIAWLRACLEACTRFAARPEDRCPT